MLLKKFRVLVGTSSSFTNCYVLVDEKNRIGAVIDPAGEIDKIENYIENGGIKLKYALITHCHADHIAGLTELKKHHPDIQVVVHQKEEVAMIDDVINMCSYLNIPTNTIRADITVQDNEEITLGNLTIRVLHTPGHTAGSVSFLVEDAVFTGDTLFKRTYGRTDLKTSSSEDMLHSIRDKLLKLPDNTIIYPGHGATSIIKEEKEFYGVDS